MSLVFGLLAWTLLPLLSALGAIICGHMARSEIRQASGAVEGDGLALAGLILGYVQLAIALLVFLLVLVVVVLIYGAKGG